MWTSATLNQNLIKFDHFMGCQKKHRFLRDLI